MNSDSTIYVYGYGNPGRQDDGLGPLLIERLESDPVKGVVTDSNYQLNIEDADNISNSSVVIFVDASINVEEPFSFYGIEPSSEITFTTHAMSPQSVLALCSDIYGRNPEAYILEMRGYEWEFNQELTAQAQKNLDEAYSFLRKKLKDLLIKCGVSNTA